MKQFEYQPKGVCSTKFIFTIDGETIVDVEMQNGCAGNLLGIKALLKNRPIQEVIDAFTGIECGRRSTSCPDQMAAALKAYLVQAE